MSLTLTLAGVRGGGDVTLTLAGGGDVTLTLSVGQILHTSTHPSKKKIIYYIYYIIYIILLIIIKVY